MVKFRHHALITEFYITGWIVLVNYIYFDINNHYIRLLNYLYLKMRYMCKTPGAEHLFSIKLTLEKFQQNEPALKRIINVINYLGCGLVLSSDILELYFAYKSYQANNIRFCVSFIVASSLTFVYFILIRIYILYKNRVKSNIITMLTVWQGTTITVTK